MPKAKVNGVEIYYETHGEGPAVVFAHGRAGSHLSWWRQVPAFRDRYRCITFDARGWGASTSQPGVNRRAAFGEDLKQLLDYLEEPQVYLVSQSMGGLTCMDFALAHPQRCLGLVLGDTTGGVGDPAVLEELKDVFPPPDGPARTMCPGFIANNPELVFLHAQIGELNSTGPQDDIVAAFRDPEGPKASDLAALNVPTLLIAGEEEAIFPPKVIRALQKLIPGAEMEIISGAAHSAHYEQPETFNRLVLDFFARIAAKKAAVAAD
jgi:3-oxoadipate enol-lactonase